MFEKELEEYVRKIRHDVINWDGAEPEERFYNEIKFKQAYQQGAEFGYQKGVQELDKKWHSLQKNPKDLPEPHSTVLDECGDKITYRGGDMWTVYSEYYEKGIDAEPPKAWCEVPTFEE